MKVLYVIESLGAGGTERSLAELLPPLATAGVSAEVVCFHRRSGPHDEIVASGVPVTVLGAGGWAGRVAAVRRRIAAWRPDLVHTALFRSDLVGRLAAAGTRVPVLASLVGTPYVPERLRDPRVRPVRLRLVRFADAISARRLCDHFHAVSHAVERAAVAALGIAPDRVTVVHRGRDPQRLGQPSPERRRRARAALGLDDADEVVLAVGRHEFAKGLPDLVAAAGGLVETRPRLHVLIAGRSGALTGELERRIAERRLGSRLRLLGHVDDVPELLAAADLLVLPSLYEGMPGAVIEAMALGLPVVATDIPAIHEVVEPGASALVVPPRDPAALAGAIGTMLSDRDRAEAFGRRGRAIFEERFTLEQSAGGMLGLYRRLVAGNRLDKE